MTHPIHFDNSSQVDAFGFDQNGDQYRFDNYPRAKAWVDEDPDNRTAMVRTTKVEYSTYQYLYCGTCGQVAPIEDVQKRVCLSCVKRKLRTELDQGMAP